MQPHHPASESAPASPASFAGLLAALAATKAQPPRAWDDDLEDDVATLRYEDALQTHARYRPAELKDVPYAEYPAESPHVRAGAPAAGRVPNQGNAAEPGAPHAPAECSPGTGPRASAQKLEPGRKSASVTIRMSRAESEQLQQRAAEAGFTVSAYLRSCAFEVEGLRAQVKDVLAELRSAQSGQKPDPPAQPPRGAQRWGWPWRLRQQS